MLRRRCGGLATRPVMPRRRRRWRRRLTVLCLVTHSGSRHCLAQQLLRDGQNQRCQQFIVNGLFVITKNFRQCGHGLKSQPGINLHLVAQARRLLDGLLCCHMRSPCSDKAGISRRSMISKSLARVRTPHPGKDTDCNEPQPRAATTNSGQARNAAGRQGEEQSARSRPGFGR